MKRHEWNLLVLSAANGRPLTPVRLQKCLYILGRAFPKEVGGKGWYKFQPYNYGAFDADVYTDAEEMEKTGLTQIGQSAGGWKTFAATDDGLKAAEKLRRGVPSNVAAYIPELVNWATSLSFEQLVAAVYKAYPETRSRSIFRG
jgi:hypothetical protein